MERKPYIWSELFLGNEKLFQEVLQNTETVFVYDIDGILANSPKIVLRNFTEKTGIRTNPAEINEWNYLTNLAKKAGLVGESIKNAEVDWYEPEVLAVAQKYLYITSVLEKTLKYYSPARNFALTSREPGLKESTFGWFNRKIPKFKAENILIREDANIKSAAFKVENLTRLAQSAPWVVFIDDSIEFTQAVVKADIENCITVNIPLGKIMPNFRHERLIVIKRFPEDIQAMYPLMYAINNAIGRR